MNVNKWGPGGWIFLHTITFNYPLIPDDNIKISYSNFFKSVGNMLPCKYCRNSYQIYYKYLPIDQFLESREGVCYWLYRLHQLVNEKIFKENTTLEHVIRKYEDIRAKCGKMTRDNDKEKIFKTCQRKKDKINIEYLNNFIAKCMTYKDKIDKMIKLMYLSTENPNKEYLKYQNMKFKKKKIINNLFLDI